MEDELYRLPGFHDPFSAMSHLFGAALFVPLGCVLLYKGRGDPLRLFCLAAYAFACVALFALSGVYHMMTDGGVARAVMGRLDHSAIFFLIAASFTPAHGILFRGPMRWGPLLLIWTGAIVGITLKVIFFDDLPEAVGCSLYLILGWMGAASGTMLGRRFGYKFIRPLLWGGIAYSVGAAMDLHRWPTIIPGVVHAHEVFHVAVLIGAILHWMFTMQFADGKIATDPGHP